MNIFSLSATGQIVFDVHIDSLRADSITNKFSVLNFSNFTPSKDRILYKQSLLTDTIGKKLNHLKVKLHQHLDSLRSKGQSTAPTQRRLDSLENLLQSPQEQYQKLISLEQKLKSNLKDKIPGVDTVTAVQNNVNRKLNEVNNVTSGLGINNLGQQVKPDLNFSTDMKVPALNSDLGITNPLVTDFGSNINSVSGEMDQLQRNVSEAGTAVKDVGQITNEASQVTKQAGEYTNDIKTIQAEGLNKSEKLPELAEQQALEIDQVKTLKQNELTTTAEIEQYKKLAEQYKNEKAIEKEMKEKLREVANDVIGQHMGVVNTEMTKVTRHMRKFSQVGDIRNLPKRAPNPMHGLHWRERIVPGFSLQSYSSKNLWLQLDPQVMYKLNGNLSAGIGGMYRFSMNQKKITFYDFGNLYGAKLFIQSYVFKGFYLRAEAQQLTWKPWNRTDPNQIDHTSVVAAGVGKSYSLGKNIKGNMQTLYHFAWGGADPYKSKIMIRFALDFSLKKKEIQSWQRKLNELKKS